MKIFVNDTVNLILNTGKNISTFTTFKIKYEDPDGTRGQWTAALYPSNNLCLNAVVEFDTKGLWKVQAYVAKVGEVYHGMWADVMVFQPLFVPTTAPATTVPPTTLAPTT